MDRAGIRGQRHDRQVHREVRCNVPALRLASALPILAVLAWPAWADDKADCQAGIDMIKAEIARNPPKPVLDRLRKALRIAERELEEGEYDECLDAVNDAKKALRK